MFQLSKHALDRALDMGLTPEQIRNVVLTPEIRIWSKSEKHGDAWLQRCGDLTAFVLDADEGRFVITFVWATDDAWKQDLAIGTYGGRTYRGTA